MNCTTAEPREKREVDRAQRRAQSRCGLDGVAPGRRSGRTLHETGALLVLLLLGCGRTPSGVPRNSRSPVATVRSDAGAPGAGRTATLPHRGGDHPAAAATTLAAGSASAASSRWGMVVSVEAHATRAGVSVLEAGGNAVDAAVATAYALAVTHPSAGNIGGGGFMLIARPGKPAVALDFREQAPSRLSQPAFDAMIAAGATGPEAAGVPGTVAGLNLALSRFGTLSRATVIQPAIELSREGHRVGPREALTLNWNWDKLSRDPEASATFGRHGRPLTEGSLLKRPALAATLEKIANAGDRAFYSGPIAAAMAATHGGIARDDLSSYKARVREPLAFGYRGYWVVTMPPPSSGGVAVALMLTHLERLSAQEFPRGSVNNLHLLAEVSRRAQAARRLLVVDPGGSETPGADLAVRGSLQANTWFQSAPPIDLGRATPSAEVHPLFSAVLRELEHTTHLSVVDRHGNAVSCTVTLSAGFGAGYVVPGTGIVMNNSLAAFSTVGSNLPAPGRRMTSSMAPTIVSDRSGVVAVVGSPGGDTIPSTIVQVTRNLIDYHLPVDAAVEAPRIHHGFAPDQLRIELRRPPSEATIAQLRALGHAINPRSAPIGDANVITRVKGVAYGHADTREGGLAAGPRHVSQ